MPRTADRRVPTARRAWQSGDLLGAVVPEAAVVGDSPAGDPPRQQPCGSNRTQHVLPDTRIYVRLSDERTTRRRSILLRPLLAPRSLPSVRGLRHTDRPVLRELVVAFGSRPQSPQANFFTIVVLAGHLTHQHLVRSAAYREARVAPSTSFALGSRRGGAGP